MYIWYVIFKATKNTPTNAIIHMKYLRSDTDYYYSILGCLLHKSSLTIGGNIYRHKIPITCIVSTALTYVCTHVEAGPYCVFF